MSEFSIWHWLVLLIFGGFVGIGYAIYRYVRPKPTKPILARTVAPRASGGGSNELGRNKMFCQQCGNANDIAAKFCFGCGSVLPQAVQGTPTHHIEINTPGNPEQFYKAIVGSKNQGYYLHHFFRFDGNGKVGVSWHWPAFFATFYWFLYRKMWLNALVYFFLPYLVMIPMRIAAAMAGKSADTIVGIGYLLFLVGIFLLPPMYANALYYKHCKKKISEARVQSHDLQRRLGELSGEGGTSNVALIVFLIFAFTAFVGILAAITIPAYHDYLAGLKTAGLHNSPVNQSLNPSTALRSNLQRDLVAQTKRAWSGNAFDQFDSVVDIERQALKHDVRLNNPRAWDAVLAWQHWYMRDAKQEPNVALYMAVNDVLEGLRGNKGICRPGSVITVDTAHASDDVPAGTQLVMADCDR